MVLGGADGRQCLVTLGEGSVFGEIALLGVAGINRWQWHVYPNVAKLAAFKADSRRGVEGLCQLIHSRESGSGGDLEALSRCQEDPQCQGEGYL